VATSWNIFTIARRGSADDEDQLTELLGYLLQEEPSVARVLLADLGFKARSCSVTTQRRVEGGRLDLELDSPGNARVVVESKLGSSTDYQQCAKYIEHLASSEPDARALVLLTKLDEAWPQGIEKLAAKRQVQLERRRWWDMALLLNGSSKRLARDFAEMLEEEGFVVPGPLREDDWADVDGIPPAAVALLTEMRPRLSTLSNGLKRQAIHSGRDKTYRSVYSLAYFERAQIGIGVAASWKDLRLHRRLKPTTQPVSGAVIGASVFDPGLLKKPESARVEAAEQAVSVGGPDVAGACWGTFPTRVAPAASVLTASDFLGQVDQVFEYARATAEHFRSVGYLKDASTRQPQ
jgi:hypothetical protein